MKQRNSLQFQKGDLLAVILVLALAAAVALAFLPKEDAGSCAADIYLNGELVKTVDLNTSQEFSVTDRYTNTITVKDGAIAITASDCPGEDCIHSGAIHSSGRSIVCLPNGVEIRVTTQTDDVDFVVG